MAYNPNTPRQEYTATGGQTDFIFNFKIFNTTDLVAYLTPNGQIPDDTADLLTITTDYTVVIDGDNGGTMTLVVAATAGDKLTLVRALPVTRDTEYQTSGDFRADVVNDDQDYQTYILDEQSTQLERTLKFQDTEQTAADVTLPSPQANYFLQWNAAGDNLENAPGTGQDSRIPTIGAGDAGKGLIVNTGESAFEIAPVANLDVQNLFTKGQRGDWVAAPTGVITLADAQHFVIVPTGNITINLPSDVATSTGQSGILAIDATTHTISWGAGWAFPGGVAPTLSGQCIVPYVVGNSGTDINGGSPTNDIGFI